MALSVVKNGEPVHSVGDRIIQGRKDKDMTQLDLAKLLGVSRAAVGQWEINATSPSIAKLEEVAMVLECAPEWLAYNVKPGEIKKVYRNPERDNLEWVAEISFGDDLKDEKKGDIWGVPGEYLTRDIGATAENTILVTINSNAVEPAYEYGDKVFVDRGDKKPSPAGTFMFWDGIGVAFAKMQAIPGKKPTVRVSQNGAETYEVPFDDITIIGRVKGRIQRG